VSTDAFPPSYPGAEPPLPADDGRYRDTYGGAYGDGDGDDGGDDGGRPTPARRAADRGAAGGDRPRDRTFALLLQAAERGMHVGLTVATSDGVLVTGTLVGAVEYDRALADQFTATHGGTDMDAEFADAFRSLVDDAYGAARGDRRATPDAAAYEQATAFVHLVEARYVSGPTFLPHGRHGVLWRCRVCDVVSWSLGDLTRS
jgi:hypothetical protein